jgi:hypothetical protein
MCGGEIEMRGGNVYFGINLLPRAVMLEPTDNVPVSHVLVLYIGGTIGMKPLSDGTLAPT